jgi:hypothetical protein
MINVSIVVNPAAAGYEATVVFSDSSGYAPKQTIIRAVSGTLGETGKNLPPRQGVTRTGGTGATPPKPFSLTGPQMRLVQRIISPAPANIDAKSFGRIVAEAKTRAREHAEPPNDFEKSLVKGNEAALARCLLNLKAVFDDRNSQKLSEDPDRIFNWEFRDHMLQFQNDLSAPRSSGERLTSVEVEITGVLDKESFEALRKDSPVRVRCLPK